MLRITGGKLRGRQIASPRGRDKVRPTTSMMRESVFSRVQMNLPGARFLDLFTGSGIMAIEAVSRGADFVLAVDRDRNQCRIIREAAEAFRIEDTALRVVQTDSLKLVSQANKQAGFDIVFMDPPYGFGSWTVLIMQMEALGWLNDNAILIAEHGPGETEELASLGFDSRHYGETTISVRVSG